MPARRFLGAVVLALLGLTGAMLEASLAHSDDGCTVETHCNACMLGLRAPGVVTVTFTLPRELVLVGRAAPAPEPRRVDAAPQRISSRGPPA